MCNYENSTFLQVQYYLGPQDKNDSFNKPFSNHAVPKSEADCTASSSVVVFSHGSEFCPTLRTAMPPPTPLSLNSNSFRTMASTRSMWLLARQWFGFSQAPPPLYTLVKDHHSESLKDSATPWRVCSKVDGALSIVT